MAPSRLWSILLLISILTSEAMARRGGGRRRGRMKNLQATVDDDHEGDGGGGGGVAVVAGDKRRGKLFSLFNIVTFQNDPCATTESVNGEYRVGTCMTSSECEAESGQAKGHCAAGFGVCCLFVFRASGSTVDKNCSYVQNDGFPSALQDGGSGGVEYDVEKCSDDVCLLRLDFETFDIRGTGGSSNANEGDCLDTFQIRTSTAQVIPVICGLNTGEHMYVDIGLRSDDSAAIVLAFDGTDFDRVWDIKLTQVECTNPNAPRDTSCLQYLTGTAGRIKTFNFDNENDNHLNNQQYSVCIRQEKGFCCVEFSVCPDELATLPGGSDAAPAGFSFDTSLSPARAKVDHGCRSTENSIDYISIPESASGCDPTRSSSRSISSRYCGQFLNPVQGRRENTAICDCTAPFKVDVFFNGADDNGASAATGGGGSVPVLTNDAQSRGGLKSSTLCPTCPVTPVVATFSFAGLCLEYTQVPC